MRCSGTLKFVFPDRKSAKSAFLALKGEEEKKKRFSSRVSLDRNELAVEVRGADVVALRATLNAYLRYLQAIEGENDG